MQLLLIGHGHAYQLQSLLAAFFPFAPVVTKQLDSLPDDLNREETALITFFDPETKTARVIWQELGQQKIAECVTKDSKKETVNLALAKLAYPLLCASAGFTLPYGIYTGIRPVKNTRTWAKEGKSTEEIRNILAEDYLVEADKINLLLDTLETQTPILEQTGKDSYSLFVFIPFCPTKCRYCSFISKAIGKHPEKEIDPYLDTLEKELAVTAKAAKEANLKLDTVYIGGGTPTVLSVPQLDRLLLAIKTHFPLTEGMEYTLEAGRPDTLTREKLLCIRSHGVNRISINPQTFKHETLRAIGRSHTPLSVLEAFAMARECGFDNINMDFISALPGEDTEDLIGSLSKAVSLGAENITLHTLTVKRSADYRAEAGFDPTGDKIRRFLATEMTAAGEKFLYDAGYMPYYLYRQKNTVGCLENTGWTKKGKACAYNIRIMEEDQNILACGANASTKLLLGGGKRIVRMFNAKFPTDYCKNEETVLQRKREIPSLLLSDPKAHLPGVPDGEEKES